MRILIVGLIFLSLTSVETSSADEGPLVRGPNYALKHVSEVSWDVIIGNNSRGEREECSIYTASINNSVQFIVNQSTRLKFITWLDRVQHYPKLEIFRYPKRTV
jgi:hypothetical protein